MEIGAKRGVEKVTRTIWKNLIVRSIVDTVINLTGYCFATYFKSTNQMEYSIYAFVTPLLSNALLVFAYNLYLLSETTFKLVRILEKVVETNHVTSSRAKSQAKSTVHRNAENQANKVASAYKRLRIISPIAFVLLLSAVGLCLGLAIWGYASIGSVNGMTYVSVVLALIDSAVIAFTFCVVNLLFIVW